MQEIKWVRCLVCGNKTRLQIRADKNSFNSRTTLIGEGKHALPPEFVGRANQFGMIKNRKEKWEVLFFMSYYIDLSTSTYVSDEEYVMTNIGWIDGLHAFNKGKVSDKFLLSLWEYIKIPINRTRGLYYNILDGCKAFIAKYEGYDIVLGSAEIRVIDMENRRIYVSPNLILHYIINHGYCPPQCFIDAVLNGPKPNSEEYKKILISKTKYPKRSRLECMFCGSHQLQLGFSYDPDYIRTKNIEILEYTNNINNQQRNRMFNVICEDCGNIFDVSFDEIVR